MKHAPIAELNTFMAAVLENVGVPASHALQIAEAVMDSELRGHPDHGLFFFQHIPRWITVRSVPADARAKVVAETPASVRVDGGGGIGVEAMHLVTDRTIERARTNGSAAGTVANTDNLVALAPFVQKVADAGMIGLAGSGFRNVGTIKGLIPPTGGVEGVFGTNPFAFAVPAGVHPAFLLDMSTSAIAGAKVLEARDRGESLPAGLLEDRDGNPVTDPALFKMGETLLLPMAGVKGYGIAMMVDLLSTVLSGDDRWGHFIWVLDPEQFMPRAEFEARMDADIERIKGVRRKPGVEEIFYPGERGQRRMAGLRAMGSVPLNEQAWVAIERVSADSGVAMPAAA